MGSRAMLDSSHAYVLLPYMRGPSTRCRERLAAHSSSVSGPCHALTTALLALPIKHKLSEELQSRVWLLCTNEVWPSDLSSCLWHHYGGQVSADLGAFRMNTRVLLRDFTVHWQRQMIVNPSFEEARQSQVESLADLVHLDRMDRVTSVGGYPKMELL